MLGGIDLSIQAVASLASVILALLLPPLRLCRLPARDRSPAPLVGLLSAASPMSGCSPVLHRHARHRRHRRRHRAGHLRRPAPITMVEERARLSRLGHRRRLRHSGGGADRRSSSWPARLFVQRYTRFGRYSLAVGAGEPAACASGINVDRTKIIAFALSATLAAFAGIDPRRPPRQRLADPRQRAAAAGHRRRHRRRHGDHRRRRQRLAHADRRADHLGGAHRHDLRRRQHLRPEHRLRRGADRSPSPSPSTAARSRSSSGLRRLSPSGAGCGSGWRYPSACRRPSRPGRRAGRSAPSPAAARRCDWPPPCRS